MSDKDKKRLILFGGIGVVILLLFMLFSSKSQGTGTVQTTGAGASPVSFPTFAPPSSYYAGGDVVLGYGPNDEFSPWTPPGFNNTVPGFMTVQREPNTPVYVPPIGSMPLGSSPCGCCAPASAPKATPRQVLAFSNSGAQQQSTYLPFAWGR